MATYRFDDLGWLAFEKLAQSLLKAQFGSALIAWGGRSDRGRDAYCEEQLRLTNAEPIDGPFVFQVKFVENANAAGADPAPNLLKGVRREAEEIKRRIEANEWLQPSRYILITNVPLTADRRTDIENSLSGVVDPKHVLSWGEGDLSRSLDNLPNIRLAFPQLLGIQDIEHLLSSVVNKDVIERSATARLEAMEVATVFTPTTSYYRALAVLSKHHFVVLTGPPEMGKTTIARMIGLAKHTEGWQLLDCTHPSDFFQNIDETSPQIFLADDAFGTTEYVPDLAVPWGQQLPKILRRLNRTRWLIWTSRPAPLKLALQHMHLEGLAERFPTIAETEVDSNLLTVHEKAAMLYRHAKALNTSDYAKTVIKQCAERIVRHQYFTPERIRRLLKDRLEDLCGKLVTDHITMADLQHLVAQEISEPTSRMRLSFENIGQDRQQILIAMLDAGTGGVSESDVQASYERLFGHDTDKPIPDLASELDGHFIRIQTEEAAAAVFPGRRTLSGGGNEYDWIHPSWRDLVIDFLRERRTPRTKFLRGCSSYGFQLALSIGGGARGDRKSPLMSDDEDWRLLGERVQSLSQVEGTYTLVKILRLVQAAITEAQKQNETYVLERLNTIGHLLLSSLLERWNNAEGAISLDCLTQYCSLSVLVRPLVPLPQLEETWNELWDDFRSAVNDDSGRNLNEAGSYHFKFIELLQWNEPRLLRLEHFPSSYVADVQAWIDAVANYDPMNGWPCDIDDAEAELEIGASLRGLMNIAGNLFPGLENECDNERYRLDSSVTELRRAIDKAEDERMKKEEETDNENEDWESYYGDGETAKDDSSDSDMSNKPERMPYRGVAEDIPPTITELFEDL